MENRDTVIVCGNDLVWEDVSLRTNRFSSYKEDPFDYINNLSQQGWRIIVYFNDHDDRFRELPVLRLYIHNIIQTTKLLLNHKLFRFDLIEFTKINFDILTPASFIIVEKFLNVGITQYAPFELFELQDVPPVIPNAIYLIVTSYLPRRQVFIENYGAIAVPINLRQRQIAVDLIIRNNPGKEIIEIYSPIYKYPSDINNEDIEYGVYNIIRYPRAPNIRYFTYGF